MAEGLAKNALVLTKRGAFEDAGDHYTQAAYQSLAHDAITAESEHQIGDGLEQLPRAALCYRWAALPTRCRNRCEQGILIATDLQHDTATATPKVAVLQEYIADSTASAGSTTRIEPTGKRASNWRTPGSNTRLVCTRHR